ncbi:MAG: Fe-S cluster assembly protein HesB, partial [Ignavibacteria bacterium]|nr:Fe-S cluster assembly protein HesB [Ignavibacteria bacterium]
MNNSLEIKIEDISLFQSKILRWYTSNKREMPWRDNPSPYQVMISEFMLQQTQYRRVIPYYYQFLCTYPDIYSLANANAADLLRLWSGLGYNSRALRLQQSARIILEKYNGVIPAEYKFLIDLPGVGDYIASAILAFAFNIPEAVIDINIKRVFIHEFQLPTGISYKRLKEFAARFVPGGRSSEWHNALMDYGASLPAATRKSSAPAAVQKPFEGSVRQLRGKIVKLLITVPQLTGADMHQYFQDPRLDDILEKMVNEQLVQYRENKYSL